MLLWISWLYAHKHCLDKYRRKRHAYMPTLLPACTHIHTDMQACIHAYIWSVWLGVDIWFCDIILLLASRGQFLQNLFSDSLQGLQLFLDVFEKLLQDNPQMQSSTTARYHLSLLPMPCCLCNVHFNRQYCHVWRLAGHPMCGAWDVYCIRWCMVTPPSQCCPSSRRCMQSQIQATRLTFPLSRMQPWGTTSSAAWTEALGPAFRCW